MTETNGGDQAATLKSLANLTSKVVELDGRIAKGEDLLKGYNDLRKNLLEVDIPQAMDILELQDYTTTDGARVTIKERIHAHISVEHQPKAFAWLRKNKFGGLIKTKLSLAFGKDESALAKKAVAALKKSLGKSHMPEVTEGVHPQTLKAFVKEQLEKGKDLPMDLLGIHRQQIAEFEVPKAPKAK